MLKAVIVYVPGSGGNLLSRSLCLSEQTVAILPDSLAESQPTYRLSSAQRLQLYNNWNVLDWTHTETVLNIWYRTGKNDFVNYEQSDLDLIDQFHPCAFENETRKQVLWESVDVWPHVIFIRYHAKSLDQIVQFAKIKRPDLKHHDQIYSRELAGYQRLLTAIPNRLEIWWEDMLQLDTYLAALTQLTRQLRIQINQEQVSHLWKSWDLNSRLIQHE
jgi:hypothetical protein